MKRIKKLRDFILINNMLSIAIPLILVGLLVTPVIYNYLIKDMYEKNTIIAATIAQRMTDFIDESFQFLDKLSGLLETDILKDDPAVMTGLRMRCLKVLTQLRDLKSLMPMAW